MFRLLLPIRRVQHFSGTGRGRESIVADTSIEWTDATWNPVAGCSIVTAGCTNCYAMRMAARLDAMGVRKYRGLTRKSGGRHVWTGRVHLDIGALELPIKWTVRRALSKDAGGHRGR
jgi:protein gp37